MNEIQKNRSHRFAQLVGLELKADFTRHEVSQTGVADRLGHSRTSFSKWLNAKPSMPMEALINTCELLGVDPREVFNAAYRRLIEEMGEYNPASAGERFVDDDERVRMTLEKLHRGDVDIVALEDEHKFDGDGDDPA